jgi:protease secretion system outer membrane protein
MTLIMTLLMSSLALAEPVSLQLAFEKAKNYDAKIRAAKADNLAQREEINKSFAALLPQARLSMYEGRGHTEAETPGLLGTTNKRTNTYDSRNYNLSIRQTLFNYASFSEYAQSKAEALRSDANFEREQLTLMSRVSGAYFDMLLAAENVQYSDAQRRAAEQQLEQAQRRFKAGVGTVTEVNEAKANLETVTAQRLEWLNSLEYNKRNLETVCGVYVNQFFTLDPNKLKLQNPQPATADEWVTISLQKNPEILAAMYEINAAEQEVNKNNAGHMPTLDLVAAKTKTESDNNFTIGSKFDTDTIGLQLNVPIYAGGYVMSAVRQAQSRLILAQERLADKQRTVANDVRRYFNEIVNGNARIEAQSQAVKSNEVAVIGTQKGYEAGMRTNVEVLNAQDKLYSAIRDLARERYKLLFNSVMLKQTSGMLQENDITEMSQLLTLLPNINAD